MIKKHSAIYTLFLWLCAAFYIAAGINHFLATNTYVSITPKWLPAPHFLILFSGLAEIVLGVLLLIKKTRKIAAWLIVLMLIAYIPVHIDMLQRAPFMLGSILITKFIAWIRLPLQLLLIFWAAFYIKNP